MILWVPHLQEISFIIFDWSEAFGGVDQEITYNLQMAVGKAFELGVNPQYADPRYCCALLGLGQGVQCIPLPGEGASGALARSN